MAWIRSRLVRGRAPAADDPALEEFLESLPPPAAGRWQEEARLGIADASGRVYRDVFVYNAWELVELTARLNSMGYTANEKSREFLGFRYARVFSRSGPTGPARRGRNLPTRRRDP